MKEGFKPIPIKPPSENRGLFAIRCAVDLQLLTVHRFLRQHLPALRGRVLDVGAGLAPWRELLAHASYVGLDVASADSEFGMSRQPDVVYYDGATMPFACASIDHVLCSEVLEHVPDAPFFMSEICRVMKPGGVLVLTVPWSARAHHVPHDYLRYTRYALDALLRSSGFSVQRIEPRGNDVMVIANKIIVLTIRLLRPARPRYRLWTWPLALVTAPVAIVFLMAAHVSDRFGWGSTEDPLGFGVLAVKT